jgi:hypothetical protein
LLPIVLTRIVAYTLLIFFVLITAAIASAIVVQISFVFLILVIWFLYMVTIALWSKFRLLFLLMKVYILEKSDKAKALAVIDSEIFDCKEVLHAEKSEMDVHRLNARDEADAIRYSRRGERDIRINLGLLQRLQNILIKSMRKEPASMYDIDLDRY